jgi:hypothetical protein
MKGTEKQVKWAEDIKAEVVRKVTVYRDYWQQRFEQKGIPTDDERWEYVTDANDALAYMEQQSEAKWWIENMKNHGKPTVQAPGFYTQKPGEEGAPIVDLVKALAYREARKATN